MNSVEDVYIGQNLTDPFEGGQVTIARVAGGLYWQARAPHWSSSLFDTRQALVFFLSTRKGAAPEAFAAEPKIQVTERVAPAEQTTEEANKKEWEDLNDKSTEAADRILHTPGIVVPVDGRRKKRVG